MKTRYHYIVAICVFFVVGCSKNDDAPPPTVVESFDPVAIEFVHADGTNIQAGVCISPNDAYAIQITTTKNDNGNTNVSKIEYTINGALYSMSFSEAGIKRNPIALVDGSNIAELTATAEIDEIFYVIQDDFELVD